MRYKKITSKQWQTYYYLLSISSYDSQSIEDHRFIYKKDLNITQTAKFLNISRPTVYTALKKLEATGLIREHERYYTIYAREWVKIDKVILKALLKFSQNNTKNIDLLRIFLLLKKLDMIATCSEERAFTKRNLIVLLGHNVDSSELYSDMTTYLALLKYWGLIEIKSHIYNDKKLGHYTIYHLQKVNEEKVNPDLIIDVAAEMAENNVMPEKVFNALQFSMPELLNYAE